MALSRKNTRGNAHLRQKNFLRDKAFQSVKLVMNRTTLFFDEKEQELQFRQHFFNKSRKMIQLCVTGLVILSLVLFATDKYYFGYDGVCLLSKIISYSFFLFFFWLVHQSFSLLHQ